MHDFYQHFLTVFFGYFAIMNPLANTAVFVGLTGPLSKTEKAKIAKRALTLTFLIIVLFAALGKFIFIFFGISLPALRIAGGILVFLIGYHMLHGEGSALHRGDESSSEDVAISPLAVPILAGPGTIATTISYSASGGWLEILITVIVFLILCGITYGCFMFGPDILKIVGDSGLAIITRLMGLILAVIGAQMLIAGVAGAFKIYA